MLLVFGAACSSFSEPLAPLLVAPLALFGPLVLVVVGPLALICCAACAIRSPLAIFGPPALGFDRLPLAIDIDRAVTGNLL